MKINYALNRIKRLAERTGKQEPMLSYQTLYNVIKQPNPENHFKKEQLFSLSLIAITNNYDKVNKTESIFFEYMKKSVSFLLDELVKKIAGILEDFDMQTDEQIKDETLSKCYYLINYQKHNRETYRALYYLKDLVKYELDVEAYNTIVDYTKQKTVELKNSKNVIIKMILIFALNYKQTLKTFEFLENAIKYQHYGNIEDYVDYKISKHWQKHVGATDFLDFCEKMRKNSDPSKALKEVEYRENEINRLNKLIWKI